MSFHTSQTFTFGEQPSATKWGYIWENDYALADGSGIQAGAITAAKLDSDAIAHGFIELKRTTLGSPGDTISVTPIPVRQKLRIVISLVASGVIDPILRFNNDSSANYSLRASVNGAADVISTSGTSIGLAGSSGAYPYIIVIEVLNIATQEKIFNSRTVSANTAGAANAPGKVEETGKWANTADAITRVDIINNGAGDFAAGSLAFVEGKD